jgi:cell division protein FtsI/penicillin-binding protein 2
VPKPGTRITRLVLIAFITFAWAAGAAVIDRRPSTRKPSKALKPATPSTAAKSAPKSRTTKKRPTRAPIQRWTESSFGDPTAGDLVDGEDLTVRTAAVAALGQLQGSVLVVDPNNGRVLSMVNQKLALASGFIPCSTIKVPVALAALNERIIGPHTKLRLGRHWFMDLTEALAISNNVYFARLGEALGFEKVQQYAKLYGFGEKAGWNIPGEQLGTFPEAPPRHGGVGRLCSFGEEIQATPLQQAAFMAALANGGTLYYLQAPRTPQEVVHFVPKVKRRLDIANLAPAVLPGLSAAVQRGTARRAYDPVDPILGKTGTCSEDGARLGWFTSYNDLGPNRLAVVVMLRGGRASYGPLAAEVAGKVYRTLTERDYFALRREPGPPAGLLPRP